MYHTIFTLHAVLFHCPPHTGLSIKHGLPTIAEISWKPLPEGEESSLVTGYKVQVVGPDPIRDIPVPDANTTSITVSELRPSTSYIFKISAMIKDGNGPSATITSTTPEEGEPADIISLLSITVALIDQQSGMGWCE